MDGNYSLSYTSPQSADYQPNHEMTQCLKNLGAFSDLPPNTWVHLSHKYGHFIPTAKNYSMFWGVQALTSAWKGHSSQQFLSDFIAMCHKVSAAFETVFSEIEQSQGSDLKLLKCRELLSAYNIFKMACIGQEENGGMHGLLKTHEPDQIFAQLKEAIEQLKSNVENTVNKCRELQPDHSPLFFDSDSFILIENDVAFSSDTDYPSQVRQNGWISGQKLFSGLNTATEMMNFYLGGEIDLPKRIDDEGPKMTRLRSVLGNPAAMLQGSIIKSFIERINDRRQEGDKLPVVEITKFYFNNGSSINKHTVAEIMATLENVELETGQAMCIPIVFEGYSWLERKHIACILIKDNVVEYFDAKGESAQKKPLAGEGETLFDLLKACQKAFAPEGKICDSLYEKECQLQFDAHNCGVFVCEFLERRLIDEQEMDWQPSKLGWECLAKMRQKIFTEVSGKIMKEEEYVCAKETSISVLSDSEIFDLSST